MEDGDYNRLKPTEIMKIQHEEVMGMLVEIVKKLDALIGKEGDGRGSV